MAEPPREVSTATFPQSDPTAQSSTVFFPQQPTEQPAPQTPFGTYYPPQQEQQQQAVPTHMSAAVMGQQQRNVQDPAQPTEVQLPPSISHLPTHIVQQYRRRFDAIDLNKDGQITLREMAAVGKVFGYKLSLAELQEIFGKRDLDTSGAITFDEFVIAMINRVKKNKELEPLRKHFARYDYLHKGYITSDEAYPVLRQELGFDMNKTESIIDMFDKNRDYRLSICEFKGFHEKVEALKAEVQTAFNEFDKDHDGYVNFGEAAEIMKPKGFTDDEVVHFFHKYDEDGDGRLNYSEFARFWDVPLF